MLYLKFDYYSWEYKFPMKTHQHTVLTALNYHSEVWYDPCILQVFLLSLKGSVILDQINRIFASSHQMTRTQDRTRALILVIRSHKYGTATDSNQARVCEWCYAYFLMSSYILDQIVRIKSDVHMGVRANACAFTIHHACGHTDMLLTF